MTLNRVAHSILIAILFSFTSVVANAANEPVECSQRCQVGSGYRCTGGGGGDGMPDPFPMDSNQRVELADGEVYQLEGRIAFLQQNEVTFRQSIVFEVDLTKHAWLAGTKRRQRPYYYIYNPSSYPIDWEAFRNKPARFFFRAKQMVGHIDGDIRQPVVDTFLVPIHIRNR